jgi:transforming growth factor-beta-induced protein
LLSFTLISCSGGKTSGDSSKTSNTLLDVAAKNNFTLFAQAVSKAEISPTLSAAEANTTAFVPTDAAFDHLAQRLKWANGSAMITALPKETLRSILDYHLLAGLKQSSDLISAGSTQETFFKKNTVAQTLKLNFTDGIHITDAATTISHVITPNIVASNGLIHSIDRVLIPPGVFNLVQTISIIPNLTKLSTLLGSGKLANPELDINGFISGSTGYTIFAPTDTAFDGLKSDLTAVQLDKILKLHILAGGRRVSQLQQTAIDLLVSISGETIYLVDGENGLYLLSLQDQNNQINFISIDILASNGVIHLTDKVLSPFPPIDSIYK